MTLDRPSYVWPGGKRSAACFSVDVDAEAPYLWQHRAAMPDTIGALEQRRFGPREGLWRLTDLLERHGIRGSFYVPGVVAETYPDILPELCRRGHEVGLHGWLHELVADTTEADFVRALDRALALFEAQTGQAPAGFRSPAWEMTPAMLAALRERGLRYDSSLMGYEHPYEIDGITEIPVHWSVDDAIYFKFLGGGADKWPPVAPLQVGEAWLHEWRSGSAYGSLFMVTVHPWISGRAGRIAMLDHVLETITGDAATWWATAAEIADWHARSPNAGRFSVAATVPTGAA